MKNRVITILSDGDPVTVQGLADAIFEGLRQAVELELIAVRDPEKKARLIVEVTSVNGLPRFGILRAEDV